MHHPTHGKRDDLMLDGGLVLGPVTGTYYSLFQIEISNIPNIPTFTPCRVAQSVGHLTRKSGVLGSIPGLATYFRFSFRFFKKGS